MKALFYALCLLPYCVSAQNLIANGSFEDQNICVEYQAKCAPEAWFRIPPTEVNVNTKKIPRVYAGKFSELVVIENENFPVIYRMFLYSKMLCPLVQGQTYTLRLRINPIYLKKYELGVLFSEEELISGEINPLKYAASVILSDQEEIQKDKKTNWRQVEVQYTAGGGEQYLTFGNFSKSSIIFGGRTQANNSQGDLIYLLDEIELTADDSPSNCTTAELNRKLLYASDHRHTDKMGVKKSLSVEVISKVQPILEKPKPSVAEMKPKQLRKFEIPNVAFDFDSDLLKPVYFSKLDSLIANIKELAPQVIEIVGYTDNIGSETYNDELSTKRALAVSTYLQQQYTEYTGSLHSEGRGERAPKVANDSEANRALNRRVEIIIYQ